MNNPYAKEGVLVGKIYLESMLDESGFGAATEWEDSYWTKAQKYPWCHNIFGHPYSLHQHQSEQLINDQPQIMLSLLVP